MKNKKRTIIILMVLIILIIIQSSCSLFGFYKTRRYIGYNSICWEDNEHAIVYCCIEQYHDVMDMGGGDIVRDWVGGELWRINANTGEKELIFKEKGLKYWERDPEYVRIDIVNNNIYISGSENTYKVKEDYSEWDSIGYFTLPIVSADERNIVAIDEEGDNIVKKYDIVNNTNETLYINPDYWTGEPDLIEWLDYDYSCNYLLVNNRKFVNLNTGEETIVVDNNTKIGKYTIGSLYGIPPKYGNIGNEYVTMDIYLNDTLTDENEYHKIRISIIDTTNKEVLENIQGVLNPDGSKYISASYDSIWVIDAMGNLINKITFDNDKI